MRTISLPDTSRARPAPHLSEAVRDGSRRQHEAAEGSRFVTELLAGRVPRAGYVDYLRSLRAVYGALEDVLRHRSGEPTVAAVWDPVLERTASLDADLVHWAEPTATGPDDLDPPPAALAYVERVRSLAVEPATRSVAHHYTRYLGDLSGGRIVGRLLARAHGLPDGGPGMAFYAFPETVVPKRYKDAYRQRLDALPLTATEQAEVVAEVQVAFDLNRGLFEDLGERWCR